MTDDPNIDSQHTLPPIQEARPTRYEYKLEGTPGQPVRGATWQEVETFLNRQGADGWKLVGIDYGAMIFMREVLA